MPPILWLLFFSLSSVPSPPWQNTEPTTKSQALCVTVQSHREHCHSSLDSGPISQGRKFTGHWGQDVFPVSTSLPRIFLPLFSLSHPQLFFVPIPYFSSLSHTTYKNYCLENGVKHTPLTQAKMVGPSVFPPFLVPVGANNHCRIFPT